MTPRVALVVTGKLEFRGLAPALKELFPTASFEVAETLVEGELRDSTSTRVDASRNAKNAAGGRLPTIDALVEHLAGCVSGRDACDLALLVEDLEIENRGNEDEVLRAVAESTARHVRAVSERLNAPKDRVEDVSERLRRRASYHLLDPMVEAYFFAHEPSLRAAGVLNGAAPGRVTGRDPERFEVDPALDREYFADPLGECERHHGRTERRCAWDGPANSRALHPKKYLKYLCREAPPHQFCSTYKESHGGVAALRALDLGLVLRDGAPFLRAMVEDIAEALGQRPAVDGWESIPRSAAPTAVRAARSRRALRNV